MNGGTKSPGNGKTVPGMIFEMDTVSEGKSPAAVGKYPCLINRSLREALAETHQDRCSLCTCRAASGVKCTTVRAGDQVLADCPAHGLCCIVGNRRCIRECAQVSRSRCRITLVLRIAVQDRSELLARNNVIGLKLAIRIAAYNAV